MTSEAKIQTPTEETQGSQGTHYHQARLAAAGGPFNLVRRIDWDERLTRYLIDTKLMGLKCDWEFNHCGGWVAGAVEEMTGVDFMEAFGDTSTPEAAYRSIRGAGFKTLDDFIKGHFPEIGVVYARRGDIVFVEAVGPEYRGLGMAHALGIADPPFFRALGAEGLGEGPLLSCKRAFKVGEAM